VFLSNTLNHTHTHT